jgi:hypothetical protein
MMNLSEQFDKLYEQTKSESFIKMLALGGEVPFFVFSYDIVIQDDIYNCIIKLKNRLKKVGIEVSLLNLYDIAISVLKKRNIFDNILEKEKEVKKERMLEILVNVLDAQTSLTDEIIDNITPESKIVFLYGVGEVFPYIRSHAILNNLQSKIKNMPTIIFFPGTYNGRELSLFGIMRDNNFYRAFNLNKLIEENHD